MEEVSGVTAGLVEGVAKVDGILFSWWKPWNQKCTQEHINGFKEKGLGLRSLLLLGIQMGGKNKQTGVGPRNLKK